MYYQDEDGQYEQDTYAGDRWGAWLDDTRLPYTPPHKSHTPLEGHYEAWLKDVNESQWTDSMAEHAEIHAAYACTDCREYAEAWSTEQAERRVGA